MIVPEYNQDERVQDTGVPTPHVEAEAPSASGAGVWQAAEGIGKGIEQIGTDVARYTVYQQRIQARQDAYDRATSYAQGLDQTLNGEGGLLTKQRGDAVGILHGRDDVSMDKNGNPVLQDGSLDPNSYIAQEAKLREKALDGLSGQEKLSVSRLIDTHATAGFNAVLKHEATQTKLAQVDSINAHIGALANSFAVDPSSPNAMKAMQQAQQERMELSKFHGEDPDVQQARGQSVADQFATAMVNANIENKPDVARDTLEKMKDQMSADKYGELKSKVDGKWIDMKKSAVAQQTLQNPKNFNPDGTVNYGAVDEQAKQLAATLPAGEQEHILDEVHKQAERQNAAVKQNQEQSDTKFSNDVLNAQRQGVPPEDAFAKLIKNGSFASDTDRQKKTAIFQSVYTKAPDAMAKVEDAILKQPDQKLTWDWVNKIAATKFGNNSEVLPGDEAAGIKTPLREAFVSEMKRQYLGKSPAEVRAGVMDAVKDVTVKPGWLWDTKKPLWQVTRDQYNLDLDKRAALSKKYGELMTSTADAYLKNTGQADTPEAIRAKIEEAKKKNGIP